MRLLHDLSNLTKCLETGFYNFAFCKFGNQPCSLDSDLLPDCHVLFIKEKSNYLFLANF